MFITHDFIVSQRGVAVSVEDALEYMQKGFEHRLQVFFLKILIDERFNFRGILLPYCLQNIQT